MSIASLGAHQPHHRHALVIALLAATLVMASPSVTRPPAPRADTVQVAPIAATEPPILATASGTSTTLTTIATAATNAGEDALPRINFCHACAPVY